MNFAVHIPPRVLAYVAAEIDSFQQTVRRSIFDDYFTFTPYNFVAIYFSCLPALSNQRVARARLCLPAISSLALLAPAACAAHQQKFPHLPLASAYALPPLSLFCDATALPTSICSDVLRRNPACAVTAPTTVVSSSSSQSVASSHEPMQSPAISRSIRRPSSETSPVEDGSAMKRAKCNQTCAQHENSSPDKHPLAHPLADIMLADSPIVSSNKYRRPSPVNIEPSSSAVAAVDPLVDDSPIPCLIGWLRTDPRCLDRLHLEDDSGTVLCILIGNSRDIDVDLLNSLIFVPTYTLAWSCDLKHASTAAALSSSSPSMFSESVSSVDTSTTTKQWRPVLEIHMSSVRVLLPGSLLDLHRMAPASFEWPRELETIPLHLHGTYATDSSASAAIAATRVFGAATLRNIRAQLRAPLVLARLRESFSSFDVVSVAAALRWRPTPSISTPQSSSAGSSAASDSASLIRSPLLHVVGRLIAVSPVVVVPRSGSSSSSTLSFSSSLPARDASSDLDSRSIVSTMPSDVHACDFAPQFDNARQYTFFLLHLRHLDDAAADHAVETQPSLFVMLPGADFARYHSLLVLGRDYLVTGLTWKILQRTFSKLARRILFHRRVPILSYACLLTHGLFLFVFLMFTQLTKSAC
jgi:hypothetical protein